ncbi:helicase-associated domain-containing protein [Paenibacillus chitinolyticus]|uniref:DNA repair helicase XPB n=1 Tax=Paenibacillus chitinolyticus TaxID=79263 RepID=UPI002DBF7846|nr:DNA repair helicase XPB [Paenibacillus chitinolyticus]MEC0246254.1 helicase-associated domain-containing protein [Paenibacillus chitinolyticus]
MNPASDNALIVQQDLTVLAEADHERFESIRAELSLFADLVKSPKHLHTYKITPLSLWNAAASGLRSGDIIRFLKQESKYGISRRMEDELTSILDRYGLLRLVSDKGKLYLQSADTELLAKLGGLKEFQRFFDREDADPAEAVQSSALAVRPDMRGVMKQELTRLGYPVIDMAGYHAGEELPAELKGVELRDYQRQAVECFHPAGGSDGGSGVLVLPCGAGKTVIGIAALTKLSCAALILTTNVTSVRQWIKEILGKTSLDESRVGEYSGDVKLVRPVTIATYQILTHRREKGGEQAHMELFNSRDWGLIIYDEVHLLPAPVFRATADIQATRRLGLTATLVREDGREEDVFSLIGPKLFDMPWKRLEQEGWIARVTCTEVGVEMETGELQNYYEADKRSRFRIAGENSRKFLALTRLLARHDGEAILIIGQYLDQLKEVARKLTIPLITGEMPQVDRQRLYDAFNTGHVRILAVSKVANFAVDLPDASVAIQLSGSYGSRQEEAQRLGRILRPKKGRNEAFFYTLVSRGTSEQEYALKRRIFLLEQGYEYRIEEGGSDELCANTR